MRCFVGIDFSSRLKSELASLQSELRAKAVSGRWKYIDNFHLTLKFLGEVEDGLLPEVDQRLGAAASKTGSFRLHISELGFFPGSGNLRVLWLGLGGDTEQLNRLQKSIDLSLEEVGFSREKRGYSPHVTIGQDIVFKQDFNRIRASVDMKRFDEIPADRIFLIKSEQIAGKRIYTPVYEHKLI